MLEIAFMLALTKSAVPIAELDRGSILYHQCQASIRVADGTARGGDASDSKSCSAYMRGFLDGLVMGGSNVLCTNGASSETLARVYVLYMEKHPKLMDAERTEGLSEALITYACALHK